MCGLIRVLTLAVWLLLACLPVLAQEGLYVGQGRLDPSAPDADAALIEALEEVLVRLTGRSDGSVREQIGLRLVESRGLVQTQQRVRVPAIDAEGRITEELRLQFQFVPAAIDQGLAAAGLPRFGPERPALLLWIAVEDEQGGRLSAGPEVELELAEQGRRLGLDIIRPLGDAIDLAELRVADVRGGFLDAAEPALARYQADMAVMLDLRELGPDQWTARWFWRIEGRDQSVGFDADAPIPLVERGMEALLADLAQRYAVAPDRLGERVQGLLVSPISDEVQYAEVLRHLQGLSMVDGLRVLSARDQAIEFELRLNSGGLIDALELGGVLQVESRLPDGRLALTIAR
jgi:hypothetical protein